MIHDLKTLVLSFHPAVAFDTPEEDRVEQLADRVADELRMPVFSWSVTKGLVQKPTAHSNLNTAEPIGVLQHQGAEIAPTHETRVFQRRQRGIVFGDEERIERVVRKQRGDAVRGDAVRLIDIMAGIAGPAVAGEGLVFEDLLSELDQGVNRMGGCR